MKNIAIATRPTVSLTGENAPWRSPAPHSPLHRFGTGVTAIRRLHHRACSPQDASNAPGRQEMAGARPPAPRARRWPLLRTTTQPLCCRYLGWVSVRTRHLGNTRVSSLLTMAVAAAVTNVISVEALPTAPLPPFHEGLHPARGRGFTGRSSRLTAPPRSLRAPSMSSGGGCWCLRLPDAEALPGAALPQVPDTSSAAAAAAGEWQRVASHPSLPPPRTAEPAAIGAAPAIPPCAGAETVPVPGGRPRRSAALLQATPLPLEGFAAAVGGPWGSAPCGSGTLCRVGAAPWAAVRWFRVCWRLCRK